MIEIIQQQEDGKGHPSTASRSGNEQLNEGY